MTGKKKMSNEQIASAITGISLKELRDKMKQNNAVHKKFIAFLNELRKNSKSDLDFVINITTYMATMIYPLSRRTRIDILFVLSMHEDENRTDKLKDMINKFKV